MKKKKISTIEDLATLMQAEFLSMDVKISKVQKGLSDLREGMHEEFKDVKSEIKSIKRDIEDLKLRMGEVPYRFELRELEKRVQDLEFFIKRNYKKA